MLKDCLEVFKREYDKYGDSLISENYKLAEGTYILVKKNGEIATLDVKRKEEVKNKELYSYIAERDYLSKYLNSNKALNTEVVLGLPNGKKSKIGTKVVYSNNYLAFFIKKETLHLNKINLDVINKYYDTIEELYGVGDIGYLEKIREWMMNNFMSLEYPTSEGKEYLKIFFEEDIDVYREESNKYLKSKIYNSTKYNTEINGVTYGLPGNNLGMNSKKPFLENKTRKNPAPYLIDEEEALLQKKFFDYLMTQLDQGKRFIYIDDEIHSYGYRDRPSGNFNGYFLRIEKGLEVEIRDMEVLVGAGSNISEFTMDRVIDLSYEGGKYVPQIDIDRTTNIAELERIINKVFFSGFLQNNYFTEIREIKLSNVKLKKILVDNRDCLFGWFYKGNMNGVKTSFARFTMEILKNTLISNPYTIEKAVEQYNLRYSVMKYLNGGIGVSLDLINIRKSVRTKINSYNGSDKYIEDDKEYYYAVGQLVRYLVSLSKTKDRNHSSLNPILNSTNNSRLRLEIAKLYKKYNYAIKDNNRRFENLYGLVLGYTPDKKVDTELMIAGYINDNLIYEKREARGNE